MRQRSNKMNFDEQDNSESPAALRAPGQFDVTEQHIDLPLAVSLEASTGAQHAPGLAKTRVDPAVMVFSLYCTQTLAARSAAPLPSSSTIH
jgi:hypothetical protein